MGTRLRIEQADAALVALGTTLPQLDGEAISVASLGDDDFNDDGDLILQSPSVRFRFIDGEYTSTRDTTKQTYNAGLQFAALVYCENLISRADERMDSLRLLGQVQDAIVGARLRLADNTYTEPIEALRVSPVMNEGKVIDQYYAFTFRVPGIAQFPAPNANFGAKA